MITKSRIVALLAILVVGFLVLRSGDEPSDSGEKGGGSESATDRQLQPQEPGFLAPSREYGIAGRPGMDRDTRSDGSRWPYPSTYSPDYGIPDPYGAQAGIRTEGYRFRPLDDTEKSRAQAPYPDEYTGRYTAPYDSFSQYYPSPDDQPLPASPPSYSAPSAYPPSQQEAYSFRPLEKSPGARGRWQGPYQEPGWRRGDLYPMDPWQSPPNPQWGSMPPSHRMYPNLYRRPDRRLTAR
ncbi:MAG: hypothetical protein LJE70_20435 [Chromatiaceae bacterium]|nr:hypothetical protein [Chromatiaceae bacterium]